MKQIGRRKHFSLKNINYLKFYHLTLPLHILPFVLMSFFSSSPISSPFILFPLLSLPPSPFLFLLSSPAVWWSNKRRRHCSFCCKGRSRKMLAPSLLCLQHVWGTIGRSHLLLPRWQDLLRPAPCWEAKTPLLCLWWGAYLGLQPFGLELAEWFIFQRLGCSWNWSEEEQCLDILLMSHKVCLLANHNAWQAGLR